MKKIYLYLVHSQNKIQKLLLTKQSKTTHDCFDEPCIKKAEREHGVPTPPIRSSAWVLPMEKISIYCTISFCVATLSPFWMRR